MAEGWTFCTMDYTTISLHDMIITSVQMQDNAVHLNFQNGFAVADNNTENSSGRSLQTGQSAIILTNSCCYDGENCAQNKAIQLEELSDSFEILTARWKNNGLSLMCINEANEFCILRFSFESVTFVWNTYSGDAWFEE